MFPSGGGAAPGASTHVRNVEKIYFGILGKGWFPASVLSGPGEPAGVVLGASGEKRAGRWPAAPEGGRGVGPPPRPASGLGARAWGSGGQRGAPAAAPPPRPHRRIPPAAGAATRAAEAVAAATAAGTPAGAAAAAAGECGSGDPGPGAGRCGDPEGQRAPPFASPGPGAVGGVARGVCALLAARRPGRTQAETRWVWGRGGVGRPGLPGRAWRRDAGPSGPGSPRSPPLPARFGVRLLGCSLPGSSAPLPASAAGEASQTEPQLLGAGAQPHFPDGKTETCRRATALCLPPLAPRAGYPRTRAGRLVGLGWSGGAGWLGFPDLDKARAPGGQ